MQRLILGSGKHWAKMATDIFVDIKPFPGVDVVTDLNITPWPWVDDACEEIAAIHLVEHLKDLISFMNECHRVLKPGGSLYIETPCAGMDADLEFADPTHIRCYRKHTFINYFTIAGIQKFGYTDKAWCIMHLEVKDGIIIFHGQPIKS